MITRARKRTDPTLNALIVLKAHGVDPHWRKGAYKDSFKILPNSASLKAKTPPRNPLQVTGSVQVENLVPVRGFEPRSRG